MDELKDKDIDIEIVPGIPSFVAAACASKTPLTVKGDSFLLCDEYDEGLMDKFNSIAILKTFKNKEELLDKLDEHDFKYTYVKRASLDNQEILSDKEEILRDKDYISLILGRKQEV
jgi:precorrin-2/cobalt-factor-2 C20-methyltransferase